MTRLKSIDEFRSLESRLKDARDEHNISIVIPAGTCGQASGANDIIRIAKRELLLRGLTDRIDLRITGCHGWCEMEPSVLVEPNDVFYPTVDMDGMALIVEAVAKGDVLEDLLYEDPRTGEKIAKRADIPFFKNQKRLLQARNERVDPIRIYNYIENNGYASLAHILQSNDPASVIDSIKESGLRGRGGAGFPTGRKWEMLRGQPNGRGKYIVCNADEGDPGAYMDRSVLEGNPQLVIEGMAVGAFATGASEGVVYVRDEYPLAIKHLTIALRQARELGLLGNNILGTGFDFDIHIVRGAGAFVCGEETALIRSIEGKMGEPRQRPPYPVQRGINGKPTVINNVETWANVPVVIEMGAERFALIGGAGNTGTKIFSLVGKIRNTGLVEVPMGTTIDRIVNEIGGGSPDGTEIKAVQTGGPSGGCIPADSFHLPVDYDSLTEAGSIMGSGGLIVMDEKTCMVDVAKYFMNFLQDESCGKCFTCRKGTQRMYEILSDITEGKGTLESLDLLEELAWTVRETTMCGLGQTAANPVFSALRYFRDEFLEHIEKGKCRAGVCKALIRYSINDNCTGCGACAKACPEGAITGEKKKPHVLDEQKCIRCGACLSVCKHDAIEVH
jgi:NADH-quinone oxidoreductase subunit F